MIASLGAQRSRCVHHQPRILNGTEIHSSINRVLRPRCSSHPFKLTQARTRSQAAIGDLLSAATFEALHVPPVLAMRCFDCCVKILISSSWGPTHASCAVLASFLAPRASAESSRKDTLVDLSLEKLRILSSDPQIVEGIAGAFPALMRDETCKVSSPAVAVALASVHQAEQQHAAARALENVADSTCVTSMP